ncbi:MAG: cyclic pyranopterin monophosphate synthase MoaC [Negativicutes bacterium]|nr:cyclic pyranopterin monophosphate synthase MoaC [Negativicutes bacterium]
MELTHFNAAGRAQMVDVSAKDDSQRQAIAEGRIRMLPETMALVKQGLVGKGDVLGVAQVAGIMGAKNTWQLIPMCHPLLLTGINVEFSLDEGSNCIDIAATVKTTGKTGVEMEALTAAAVAALTIYDMCKAVDKGMQIEFVRLAVKTGGKSGTYRRDSGD